MQTKLTLRLEESVIEKAKQFAQEQEKSLSRIVSDYFKSLSRHTPEEEELGPMTRSLLGVLEGSALDEQAYKDYLEEKHR